MTTPDLYNRCYQSPAYRMGVERQRRTFAFLETALLSHDVPVLDVGCGRGEVVEHLRKTRGFKRVVGVDFSRGCHPTVVANSITLPFRDKSFGLSTCFDVLEHIPHPGCLDTVAEMRRVTAGPLMLSIAHGPSLRDLHVTIASPACWASWLQGAGFKATENGDFRHGGEWTTWVVW